MSLSEPLFENQNIYDLNPPDEVGAAAAGWPLGLGGVPSWNPPDSAVETAFRSLMPPVPVGLCLGPGIPVRLSFALGRVATFAPWVDF